MKENTKKHLQEHPKTKQTGIQNGRFSQSTGGVTGDLHFTTKRCPPGVSLTGKKKKCSGFPKKPAGTPCAQPWLVAVGGWRLAAVGGWRLVAGGWWLEAVGSGWQLAVGRRWRLAAVGGWRLVVGGWWRLAVDGSWRLAVGGPLGRSLRAVLSKKQKISSLKDAPAVHSVAPSKRGPKCDAHIGRRQIFWAFDPPTHPPNSFNFTSPWEAGKAESGERGGGER